MNPALKLAGAALAVALAIGGSLYIIGRPGGVGSDPTPPPTATPVPTPSPSSVAILPSPTPWTGACTLVTSDEAEETAGVAGLGAIPFEVVAGEGTICGFADGGGTPVLNLTWTPVGGTALFDAAQAKPGVEAIPDLGDAAVFDPATVTLHVRQGDAHLAVFVGNQDQNRTPEDRRARAIAIAELALPRM